MHILYCHVPSSVANLGIHSAQPTSPQGEMITIKLGFGSEDKEISGVLLVVNGDHYILNNSLKSYCGSICKMQYCSCLPQGPLEVELGHNFPSHHIDFNPKVNQGIRDHNSTNVHIHYWVT